MKKSISIFFICFCLALCFADNLSAKQQVKEIKNSSLAKTNPLKKQQRSSATASITVTAKVLAGGPTETIRSNIEQLKQTLKEKKDGKAKNKQQRNNAVRQKVRLLLDYGHLGKLSLGKYWAKTSAKNRRDFLKLFRLLIERSYLEKLDGLVAEYQMTFDGEKIEKQLATVDSKVIREMADVEIKYLMEKKKNWVVYNIVFDDLDLAKNYRSQFAKIISEKGMAELLKKMRKKLATN